MKYKYILITRAFSIVSALQVVYLYGCDKRIVEVISLWLNTLKNHFDSLVYFPITHSTIKTKAGLYLFQQLFEGIPYIRIQNKDTQFSWYGVTTSVLNESILYSLL